MRRVLVALIIYRNRYLISRIASGGFSGQWEFPSGPANTETTDFETIKTVMKEALGIEIFPYIAVKELVYKSPDETIGLTLIKCSISDETKDILSVNVPSKYKWISLPYVAHIGFAPRDKNIVRHLTNGLFLVPPKRIRRSASKRKKTLRQKTAGNRRTGFASMDKERLFQITSAAGKAAHAMGRAHKWTPEEARHAGKLGASKQKLIKRIFNKNDNPTRQRLLTLLLDSLSQRPGEPVSFVTLGRALGISRQYVRHLYHQLKTVYPVPPVGKRGFGANPPDKRALIARKGAKVAQTLMHRLTGEGGTPHRENRGKGKVGEA